ncbi:MAG: class I SAM-dependent methyltransferase [Polyangiaceae bacterium]
MREKSASRTAMFMAAYRARATRRGSALASDPFAHALAGEEGEALAREYDRVYAHMELWTELRTAFIDAEVRASTAPQIVILGAGFDTRAARLAQRGAVFFEVDHPDTQAEKLERVRALEGYPVDQAVYVQCDFEREDFVERLSASGYSTREPALIVWEGVTPYLTEAAVRGTLRRVASGLDPRTVIVFDHLGKKIVSGDVGDARDLASREFVGALGEPLRWGCDDVLPVLYEEGFRKVRTTTFDEVCLNLTGTYDRARKFRFQRLSVASVA